MQSRITSIKWIQLVKRSFVIEDPVDAGTSDLLKLGVRVELYYTRDRIA